MVKVQKEGYFKCCVRPSSDMYKLTLSVIAHFSDLLQIIYVARNAKDTCVSYYHHCKILEGYSGSFDNYCKLFIGGSCE
jgi:estrone sulfotransferase